MFIVRANNPGCSYIYIYIYIYIYGSPDKRWRWTRSEGYTYIPETGTSDDDTAMAGNGPSDAPHSMLDLKTSDPPLPSSLADVVDPSAAEANLPIVAAAAPTPKNAPRPQGQMVSRGRPSTRLDRKSQEETFHSPGKDERQEVKSRSPHR